MTGSVFESLQHALGYRFTDVRILQLALTHRSFSKDNNERLEFLGDSLLGFFVAQKLFREFQTRPEGDLSQLRVALVRKETLASIARDLSLGEYLRLGSGEVKSGGATRDSILADAFEAVIAAIYLDGGISNCERSLDSVYADQFRRLSQNFDHVLKDAKTRLQEYLQSQKLGLPVYSVQQHSGAQHNGLFEVLCTVDSKALRAQGVGRNIKAAQQAAAREMLIQLGVVD